MIVIYNTLSIFIILWRNYFIVHCIVFSFTAFFSLYPDLFFPEAQLLSTFFLHPIIFWLCKRSKQSVEFPLRNTFVETINSTFIQ